MLLVNLPIIHTGAIFYNQISYPVLLLYLVYSESHYCALLLSILVTSVFLFLYYNYYLSIITVLLSLIVNVPWFKNGSYIMHIVCYR